ncbi:uncharacterized protein ACMZJ9_012480 [Mantella aurantiaca]
MLYYDAASQTMRASKQRKINTLLKQYVKRTLENAEKIGLQAANKDAQYHAEITYSIQIVRDFLKCIKENDCDVTILEEHLQNIQFRFKTEDDKNSESSEDTFPIVFDRVLEVAILFLILVGFLELVKNFTLLEWLICIITLACKFYSACDFKDFTGFLYRWDNTVEDISVIIYLIILRITVTLTLKCLKKFFHRKHLQIEDGPQNLEDDLCYGIEEVPVANVIDERLGEELNQIPSSSPSPERPQGRLKSYTDGFKNSENDREQLQEQPSKDSSDSLAETSHSIETSGSLSFVVIEEEKDS